MTKRILLRASLVRALMMTYTNSRKVKMVGMGSMAAAAEARDKSRVHLLTLDGARGLVLDKIYPGLLYRQDTMNQLGKIPVSNTRNHLAEVHFWMFTMRRLRRIEMGEGVRGALIQEVRQAKEILRDTVGPEERWIPTSAAPNYIPGWDLENLADTAWTHLRMGLDDGYLREFVQRIIDQGLSWSVLPTISTSRILLNDGDPVLAGCARGITAFCLYHGYQAYPSQPRDLEMDDEVDVPSVFLDEGE
jgi:hypothetical protein